MNNYEPFDSPFYPPNFVTFFFFFVGGEGN